MTLIKQMQTWTEQLDGLDPIVRLILTVTPWVLFILIAIGDILGRRKLKAQIDHQRSLSDDLRNAMSLMGEEKRQAVAALKERDKEVKNLESASVQAGDVIAELKVEREVLAKEKRELSEQLGHSRRHVDDRARMVDRLTCDIRDLKKDLEREQRKQEQLDSQRPVGERSDAGETITELQRQVKSLEDQLAGAKHNIKTLMSELGNVAERANKLESEKNTFSNSSKHWHDQFHTADSARRNLAEDKRMLENKLNASEKGYDELCGKYNSAMHELTQFKEQGQGCHNCPRLAGESNKYYDRLKKAEARIEELEQDIKAHEADGERVGWQADRIREYEKVVEDLRQQCDSLRASWSEVKNEAYRRGEKIEELEEELSKEREERAKADQLWSPKKTNSEEITYSGDFALPIMDEIHQRSIKAKDAIDRLAKAQAERDDLKKQVATLSQAVKDWKSKYDKVSTNWQTVVDAMDNNGFDVTPRCDS